MLKGLKTLCAVWPWAVAVLCILAMEVSSQCWESSHCQDLSTEENMLECIELCRSDSSQTAETPVYPGEGHLQTPVYPGEGHLQTPVYPGEGHLQTPVYPGEGHLQTPVYPGEGHLQTPEPEGPHADSLPVLTLATAGSPEEKQALPGQEEKQAFPGQEEKQAFPGQEEKQAFPGQEEKRSISTGPFRWGKPVVQKRRPVKVPNLHRNPDGVKEELDEVLPGEMWRSVRSGVDYGAVGGEAGEKAAGEKAALAGRHQQETDGLYEMNHLSWSNPPTSERYGGFGKSWDERSQKPLLTLFRNAINEDGQQKHLLTLFRNAINEDGQQKHLLTLFKNGINEDGQQKHLLTLFKNGINEDGQQKRSQ